MKTKILFFSTLLIFSCANKSSAQGEANIWYFGDHAGLDFNGGAPIALTNSELVSQEGCATISSSTGVLQFYTDGITVWNSLHNPMPNGVGLLGDQSATQSAIIVPKPGSSTIYYVFTIGTWTTAELRYSEIDMTLDGGLGDVTANKNIHLATSVTEKLTAVKKANNADFWIIAHDFYTNSFLVYSVTSAGVNNTPPVISNTGFNDGNGSIGYLKATDDGSMLVQAITFEQTVNLLNFNKTTGVVTSNFTFTPPYTYAPGVYGVEFSSDGTRLYLAANNSNDIYQYDMTLGNSAAIIASATIIGTATSSSINLGALQRAPDGKIYVAKYLEGTLGCINNPNVVGIACSFVDSAVNLLGMTNRLGLPNFIQTYFNVPSVTYANTCVGSTTFFSLSDTTTIDSVFWNFNDPTSTVFNISTFHNPSHIFTSIGEFYVSAVIYVGSSIDTVTILITITENPVITIGNDTSLCIGSTIILDPGAGSSSYLWQNSSTNQTFSASTPGAYYVTVTNNCGTTTDTIQLSLATITVSVNDVSICEGESANLIANGATTYSWSSGATSTGNNTAVAAPEITSTYFVIGTSGTCSDTALSEITVLSLPTANAGTDIVISTCASVPLNATGNGTYSWSPSTELSCSNCFNPIAYPFSTTDYCLTITDTNGCMNSDCVRITILADYAVPTAFSPNNDGHNDLLILHGFENCFEIFSMIIFNRWGEKVFETEDTSKSWDGTYKGKPMDAGVFVYVINGVFFNGEKINRKGNISLIR